MRTRISPRPALAGLAALFLLSCADGGVVGPNQQIMAELAVTASVSGTPIATLVIDVTGPGISPALVFNLTVVDGFATGTLRLPPGEDRTISARALDETGEVTHDGSKTVDILPGQNPPVSIPMVARGGQQPITIAIGDVSIVIAPPNLALEAGTSSLMTATIRAPNGDIVDDQPVWATSDPSVLTVNDGLINGIREGTADIVATFAGVAAVAPVTVTPSGSNLVPNADAGLDQFVAVSGTITLDGTASSDPEALDLTYEWTQLAGPDVTGGAGTLDGASPTFTAPDGVGTLRFELRVNDGVHTSAPDIAQVTTLLDPTRAVFVTVLGSDAGAGTRESPLRQIQAGISAAAALGPGAGVYVGDGVYNGSLQLATDVSVLGGFTATDWSRTAAAATIIAGQATAISGDGVQDVIIGGLEIRSANASGFGASSYGVRLSGGSSVVIEASDIIAGRGATGLAGPNGAAGLHGFSGGFGSTGCSGCSSFGFGGSGASSSFGLFGGSGGRGGYGSGNGFSGSNGSAGAAGGAGGVASGGCFTESGNGSSGATGAFGNDGSSAPAAAVWGSITPTGYAPSVGDDGGDGTDGRGGGGGGGGGGGEDSFFCNGDRAGGGGGGGAGGAGGKGGKGGAGGGGSFGVFVADAATTLTVRSTTITTDAGGTGGSGGRRGARGSGGFGGSGGSGPDTGGNGGPGGRGGFGGIGGAGANGAGGPSVGILYVGLVAPETTDVSFVLGLAGLGGANFQVPQGPTGTTAEIVAR